jgi:hypothetical protein
MTKAEELFHKIASELPDVQEGKMFGAMCIKAPNGEAGVMFHSENIVVKLAGDVLNEALKLKGAKFFDPMGGRPMGGWVQLTEQHTAKWKHYSAIAMEEVKKIEVVKKEKKK